jgi:hypothetical protein
MTTMYRLQGYVAGPVYLKVSKFFRTEKSGRYDEKSALHPTGFELKTYFTESLIVRRDHKASQVLVLQKHF